MKERKKERKATKGRKTTVGPGRNRPRNRSCVESKSSFVLIFLPGALMYTFYGYSHSVEGAKTHEQHREFILSETPEIRQQVQELQPSGTAQ